MPHICLCFLASLLLPLLIEQIDAHKEDFIDNDGDDDNDVKYKGERSLKKTEKEGLTESQLFVKNFQNQICLETDHKCESLRGGTPPS